ncbi:MAG: hypothetical protein KA187_00085, partial [Arenimonas sp.]|nr:hypothetical protein [Arenimonas sp.]
MSKTEPTHVILFCAALLPATAPSLVFAQDVDALAKKLSNPIASLSSVPLQLNWDTDLGVDGEGERLTLNVQPVIPVSISDDWNMISRTILPITNQSDV